jgi:outer membrane protein assembly factor BamB
MVADGKVFLGDEDGELTVLPLAKELPKDKKQIDVKSFDSAIYSTPTIANGKMFVTDRSRLYCFKVQ